MSEHNEPQFSSDSDDEIQFSRDSKRSAHSTQIDRMVSGDLSESERLDLLGWLDESPERWRHCGLAYLEAQSFREALAAFPVERHAAVVCSAARPRRSRIARVAAGIVALLLAFLLGRESLPQTDVEPQIAEAPQGEVAPHVVGQDRVPGSPQQDEPLEQNLIADASLQDGVAIMRLRTGTGDGAYELSVPVRFTDGAVEILERPAELPEYVRQQWERKGYQVSQQRRTIQLTLANGRQLDVPVDQFLLTYVGRPML